MARWLPTLLTIAVALPGGARAHDAPAPAPTAPFWQAAHDPDALRAHALVRQARALLYPTLGRSPLLGSLGQAKRVAIDAALARLALARRMDRGNVEALFLTGMALAQWEQRTPSGDTERRDREAIEALEQLRALDPRYEAFDVAFELAILYTREGRFQDARRAWQRALAVELDEPGVATVYGNLAEVTMMAGDLAEAARFYERAVAEGDGESRILPMWGLAVVLDRLGEPSEALRWAQRALEEDQRPMAVLRAPGVFFVPAHELHYYTGIGRLAQASTAHAASVEECRQPLSRQAALEGASREVLQYITRLSELLGEHLPGSRPVASLQEAARSRLTQRNRTARREGDRGAESTREAEAFVGALAALRDFHRYLAEGGEHGIFADVARAHTEALQRCLGLSDPPAPRARRGRPVRP